MRVGLICLLVLSSIARAQAQSRPDIDRFVHTQMERRHIPGLQLAVVQKGRVVLLRAYGVANIQDAVAVDDTTLFSINSITKAFTGVAIMQLVEAGKLELGAPVSRYLDGLPESWRAVSVRQLLTHNSGLPAIMDNWGRMLSPDGDDASWAKVQAMPLEFKAGARFSYNQTNYLLLGRIIDKLSGQSFTDFITKRQLLVADMPRTRFGDSRDVVPHSARGYSYLEEVGNKVVQTDRPINIHEEFPPSLRTATGLYSTAQEMTRWIIALQSGKLLANGASLQTLWTAGVLNDGTTAGFGGMINGYALGWPTVIRPEHRALAPIGGGRAALFVYPDDDLALVVLGNLRGANPEVFMDQLAGFFVPDMRALGGFGVSPAIRKLGLALARRGFTHAPEVVAQLKREDEKLNLAESDLNVWGYRLLDEGQIGPAIEIMKLDVALHPQSANTYDSLAEVYEVAGQRQLAMDNYRRSLRLDPKNHNAVVHLDKLTR